MNICKRKETKTIKTSAWTARYAHIYLYHYSMHVACCRFFSLSLSSLNELNYKKQDSIQIVIYKWINDWNIYLNFKCNQMHKLKTFKKNCISPLQHIKYSKLCVCVHRLWYRIQKKISAIIKFTSVFKDAYLLHIFLLLLLYVLMLVNVCQRKGNLNERFETNVIDVKVIKMN